MFCGRQVRGTLRKSMIIDHRENKENFYSECVTIESTSEKYELERESNVISENLFI